MFVNLFILWYNPKCRLLCGELAESFWLCVGVPIMGRGRTRRKREILPFVQRSADAHGSPPSVREIGQALGLTSSSTVHSHLSALGKKGYLRRDPSKPRALEVLRNEHEIPSKKVVAVPVIGQVTAG